MKGPFVVVCLTLYSLLYAGCVSFDAQYKGEWQRSDETSDPYFSVYLIGDAGYATVDSSTIVFNHLKKELDAEKVKAEEIATQLQAEKAKNIELESKLEKEPAAEKIVKTELKVAEPKNAKQRLLNVALEARNRN